MAAATLDDRRQRGASFRPGSGGRDTPVAVAPPKKRKKVGVGDEVEGRGAEGGRKKRNKAGRGKRGEAEKEILGDGE